MTNRKHGVGDERETPTSVSGERDRRSEAVAGAPAQQGAVPTVPICWRAFDPAISMGLEARTLEEAMNTAPTLKWSPVYASPAAAPAGAQQPSDTVVTRTDQGDTVGFTNAPAAAPAEAQQTPAEPVAWRPLGSDAYRWPWISGQPEADDLRIYGGRVEYAYAHPLSKAPTPGFVMPHLSREDAEWAYKNIACFNTAPDDYKRTQRIAKFFCDVADAPQAPAVPPDVARDAERYRWLRKSRSLSVDAPDANEDGGTDTYYTLREAALDARIDEELALNKSLAEAAARPKP